MPRTVAGPGSYAKPARLSRISRERCRGCGLRMHVRLVELGRSFHFLCGPDEKEARR